ncbi:hypothetical protein OIU78_017476 [Salix suchowensis]|nr:hypothetical protein OIU78_017476 [Salix suchowensis]
MRYLLGDRYSRTKQPTSTRLCLRDISAASLNAKTFEHLFPTVSQIDFGNVEGLESIALSSDQMTSHGHGSQKDFLQRLEDVKVNRCRDILTLFPAKWRQALNNLTSVEIEKLLEAIRLLELKYIWKGPTRYVSLHSLVHLELRCLNKLTFIFTPHLAQSLVHLEKLQIGYCSGLKHLIGEKDDEREIIPESLGFPKLKTLSISDCDQLEYVFPVSVSPSLLNLEDIFCANLRQIFYSGEDALTRDGVINFPQLRKLYLSSGCSFFGPKNFTAQLPSLQVLYIEGHEKLGDLLAQLQLWYCEKLTHVFTCSMVSSLGQLQFLEIFACEELEQIIANDEKDKILCGSDLQSLCFPNLCKVEITRCNKLRSLFPVAMASGLPKLKSLDVEDSSQLLGVFGQDDDASPVNVEKQMVLPNLSFLQLYNLPSIVCFSLGCDDFLFPRLGNPKVDKCPKLTTKFA